MGIGFHDVRAHGRRGLIRWPAQDDPLHDQIVIPKCAWHWISDESIAECLEAGVLEDINKPRVEGQSYDAARVASMVAILMEGGKLHSILATITRRNLTPGDQRIFELSILDGHHRLRAYQFCKAAERMRARMWDLPDAAGLFDNLFTAAGRDCALLSASPKETVP